MPVTLTSLTSYREHVLSGKATSQRNRILTCLFESAVPLTRLQISKITRIRLSSVCGRVNVLLKSDLVKVAYEARDPQTEKLAEFVEPRWPHLEQKELF